MGVRRGRWIKVMIKRLMFLVSKQVFRTNSQDQLARKSYKWGSIADVWSEKTQWRCSQETMAIYWAHHEEQEPDNNCRMVLTWTPEGRRKRGRPKTTWRMTVEKERGRAGWRSWNRYVQLEKLNQGKLYHSIITPKVLVVTEQKVFPEKGCEQGRSEGSPGVPVTPPPPYVNLFLRKQNTIFRGENAMTIIFDTVWPPSPLKNPGYPPGERSLFSSIRFGDVSALKWDLSNVFFYIVKV